MTQPRFHESNTDPAVAERRLFARINQQTLMSNQGPVIDLSRTGMRVNSTRKLRGSLKIILFNRNGPHIEVYARVVWTRRLGFRKHVSGLEFIDPPPSFARELANIGTS